MPDTRHTLRVLTFDPEPPPNLIQLDNTIACDGTMTCPCAGCEIDRARLIRRPRRPDHELPIKHRRAA